MVLQKGEDCKLRALERYGQKWRRLKRVEAKGLTRSDFWIYKRPLAGGGILDACKPVLTLSSAPRAHANAISPPTCMYTKAVEEANMLT